MTEEIHEIALSQIDADFEWNCRRDITEKSVGPLIDSIQQRDLEIPVTVRQLGPRYGLVVGFRRFKAFQIMEREFIPAFVRELTDYEARLANFRENTDREQLSFWEDCLFVQDTFPSDMQQTQIQEELSRPYGWLRPRRQIWNLPESIVKLAETGVYTAHDIGELLKKDPAQQQAAGMAATRAAQRGGTKKEVRKSTIQRRKVRGRKNMVRMANILEEKGLSDPKMQQLLLWAVSDIDKIELAKRLEVDPEIFLAIEE